jgi:predicted Zn-dependent protease
VVDDPVVNAFALPGGFLYVTRGILAHFGSEAELASVLGHEIGHVTARHSVERISKAQLATLGLGVAMIASREARQFGDLAQVGLGLLFLKFSRDDERQADDLGLRYTARGGYDPREMPRVFATLERVSAKAGGRVPGWLATHPTPEDRAQRLSAQIAALPPEQRQGKVESAGYLRRLEGLTFGPDPREGFFQGSAFYHPAMAFRLAFPAGWTTQNTRQAVFAVSPGQDAAVVLMLASESSPEAAAREFFAQPGVEQGSEWRRGLFHFRTVPQAGSAERELRGIAGFFTHQGRVFHLRGLSVAEAWPGAQGPIAESLTSFARLTDRRYLDVRPAKLAIAPLAQAMTLAEFVRRHPSTADLETLAILNGVRPDEPLPAGRLVKRVVGGDLPEAPSR